MSLIVRNKVAFHEIHIVEHMLVWAKLKL